MIDEHMQLPSNKALLAIQEMLRDADELLELVG